MKKIIFITIFALTTGEVLLAFLLHQFVLTLSLLF